MSRLLDVARAIAFAVLMTAAFGAVLFLSVGRWNLLRVWVYLGVYGALAVSGQLTVSRELVKERFRLARQHTSLFVVAVKLVFWAHVIVAGLDIGRYRWSDSVPVPLGIVGMCGVASGGVLLVWSMAVNRFFVQYVRVQPERGHHVVAAGPYRYLRHPGYLGLICGTFCSGLALGSWLSVVPAVVFVALLVGRTAGEDRFLHEKLDGYAAFAAGVRHRLVPGLW